MGDLLCGAEVLGPGEVWKNLMGWAPQLLLAACSPFIIAFPLPLGLAVGGLCHQPVMTQIQGPEDYVCCTLGCGHHHSTPLT